MKILVVDDNEDSRLLVRTILEAQGHQIECAEDGYKALKIAACWQPGIIISDIMMPNMDGFEFCRKLKNDPELKSIPVVLFSVTYTDIDSSQLAKDVGASKFIIKTMKPAQFVAEINEVIQEYTKTGLETPTKPTLDNEKLDRLHYHSVVNKLSEQVEELNKINKALRKSEESYRTLVEGTSDAIITINDDTIITSWNPSAEMMFGYRASEVIGKPISCLVPERLSGEPKMMLAKVKKKGFVKGFESVRLAKDGTEIQVEISLGDMQSETGRSIGTSAIVRDITERKKAEKEKIELEYQLRQAQKMEAIGILAGGIAHDFNNILSIILGYTDMAKEDSSPDSQFSHNLNQVLQAGYRARDLVKQILAFSRQAQVEKTPLKLQPIIKQAMKMVRSSIPTTIEIQENISQDCGVINADPTQLYQILMNLCTNAFHAMEEKGGVLKVSLQFADSVPLELHERKIEADEIFIELSISDTGLGIGPDAIEKIFDPFFTTKEKGKGTGMGLAITYGIVKEYGGAITVDSLLGNGTTFHIYLPQSKLETVREPSKIPAVPEGSERILFVDDEELLANLGKAMLERLGYHVTVKQRSFEALETFRNQPDKFDLVITDQTMPGMTGLDLARRMMQIRPDIPVILCTGYSTLVNEDMAKAQGIKEFALKPITKSTIAKLIRQALDAAK